MKKTNSMRQVLIILAVTATMVSCKSNSKDDTKVLSASELKDSIELAKWKESKAKSEAAAKTTVVNTPAAAPAEQTAAPKKKGWSKAAKGAVIGGVAGAAAGAIIDKKHPAAGAVIGGAAGAGVGYGIGRAKDKKDGRN